MTKYLGVKCHALCNLLLKWLIKRGRGEGRRLRERKQQLGRNLRIVEYKWRVCEILLYCSFNFSIAASCILQEAN